MQTLNLIFLPLLLLSSLLLHASCTDLLYPSCSNSGGTFTPIFSNYAHNLDHLISTLIVKVPPTGFGLATAGSSPFTAYGLALCRGDVSSSVCEMCVKDASAKLRETCIGKKEAIIWVDDCMVRYAAWNFFGTVEDGFRIAMWNNVAVPDVASFNKKVVSLLKRVSSEAYGNEKKLFGTEEAEVVVQGKKEKLYSLAQCTRDIRAKDCKSCLKSILGNFPECCSGKRGGRLLTLPFLLNMVLLRPGA